jgi:transposase
MRAVLSLACGLDVHKRSVTACLIELGARGQVQREVRTFETTTSSLLELASWLSSRHCQHVAMESTGVYWKPVFNVLEGVCEHVMLVNAQHIKAVPGRKTDVKDSEWIADLLVHGLLTASFVPPKEIRELRDLTRYRKKLIQQRADQCNRIQKLLEACNIKLASVATDVLGASGREMLETLVQGETDPASLADLAKGRLRKKIPELTEALRGVVSDTHRWLLREQLEHISHLDQQVARLDEKIEELLRPFESLIDRLCAIPGVSRRIAQVVLAEIGMDMKRFPTSRHLASWAGICPGHHESAGKRQSGRTRHGSCWLRAALVEAGWAASHTKTTYLSSQYRNIARRRGKKRACMAVGHSILTIIYELISHPDLPYQELTADAYRLSDRSRLKFQLLKRLQALGVKVEVYDPHEHAAQLLFS